MKATRTLLSAAMATALGSLPQAPAEAIVLSFMDNLTPQAFPANPDSDGMSNTSALPIFYEFRMLDASGNGGGGPPIPGKDLYIGNETWTFNNGGQMTKSSVPFIAPATNPGATAFPGSASVSKNTNPVTGRPAPFFGAGFNFLAPVVGSLAGNTYGPATISAIFTSTAATTGTMTIQFPTMEAQWSAVWFPLGKNNAGTDTLGVTFTGPLSNCTAGTNCSFRIQAQETINKGGNGVNGINEDPSSAGFGNWTAQWDLVGTVDDLSMFAPTTTTTTAPTTTTTTTTTTVAGPTTTLAPGATTAPTTTTTTAPTTTTTTAPTTTTTAAPATTTTTTTTSTTTTTVAPVDENAASIITAMQNGQVRSEWLIGDGDVTVTSNSPSSNCNWSNSDNELAFFDPLVNPATIPGELLQEGISTLRVTCSPEGEKIVSIISAYGAGGSEDANNNGLGDDLEPAGLEDNQMPINGPDGGIMESSPGTSLEMGETAFEAGNPGVGISADDIINSGGGLGTDGEVSASCVGGCFSFKVTGISPVGSSVKITMPISEPIPAGAVYRKFFPGGVGWKDFNTDAGDTVSTFDRASATDPCPAPGSIDWTVAPTIDGILQLPIGHDCIQLMMKDGGFNDTDGSANGQLTDPPGVANGDTEGPVITLSGRDPQRVTINTTYKDPGFTATDNVDGDITNQVIVTGNIDTSHAVGETGLQQLQYDVVDAAGNPATTMVRTVEVSTDAGAGGSKNRLGCMASPDPVSPATRGDWWLMGGLLAWLGTVLRRRRRI